MYEHGCTFRDTRSFNKGYHLHHDKLKSKMHSTVYKLDLLKNTALL